MVNFSLEVTLNEDDLKCLKMNIVIRLNILNMMAFFNQNICPAVRLAMFIII